MSDQPERVISARDRLALVGGIEVIRIYQRMIDETATLMAKIVGAREDPDLPHYFGAFSDEVENGRQSTHATVSKILDIYNVTVREEAT